MWLDETVFVVGGGPSLLGMDLQPIHVCPVLGVNNAFELGLWVDVTFFGDKRWFEINKDRLLAHPSLVVTCNPWSMFTMMNRVKQLPKAGRNGLYWKGQDKLCWNQNSGAAAINLAVLLGAKRIVLLGFDMKVDEAKGYRGGHNWHAYHEQLNSVPRKQIYGDRFLDGFKRIKADLETMNSELGTEVEILNATPDSAMDLFPMVKLEEVLACVYN